MEIIDGIGFGRSGAIIFGEGMQHLSTVGKTPTGTAEDKNNSAEWAIWGDDNQQPARYAEDIENCGVLSAGLDAKSRISAGKGIQPFLLKGVGVDGKEDLDWVSDSEIHDWLEENNLFDLSIDFAYDKNAYGWRAGSFVMDVAREKIKRVFRKDVYECRLQKKDDKGFIKTLIMSADWQEVGQGGKISDKMVVIPALREGMELEHLTHLLKNGTGYEYAFIDRRRRNGRHYYPTPLWFAAKQWVKLARAIPGQKLSMFKNQITIKYQVTISQQYWNKTFNGFANLPYEKQLELMNQVYDNIDSFLSGNDNAFKSLFSSTSYDAVTQKEIPDVRVEAIDDKIKDGKMLPDSAAANSEILFAIEIHPSLMGANQPGGMYSGSSGGTNSRENYLIQIMLLDEERKMNSGYLNVVKNINGWVKKFPKDRLVFRYQSNLLTTLDTGKSTKAENLG